jgi:hypothetical protein
MSKSLAVVTLLLTFAVLAAGMTLLLSSLRSEVASSLVRLDELPAEARMWFR